MWCGENGPLTRLADDYGTLSKSGFTLVQLPTNPDDTNDNCHLELKAHMATTGINSESFKLYEKINATNPAKTWGLISPTATASGTTASTGRATATSGSIPTISSSGGLSSGAIAGIAVGCSVVGIFLISAVATLIFRRRKAARKASEHTGGEDDQTSWRHELLGSAQHEKDGQKVAPTQEKLGQPVVPTQEMDGHPVVPTQEMDGQPVLPTQELEGDRP